MRTGLIRSAAIGLAMLGVLVAAMFVVSLSGLDPYGIAIGWLFALPAIPFAAIASGWLLGLRGWRSWSIAIATMVVPFIVLAVVTSIVADLTRPVIRSVAFGSGGSGCEVANDRRAFERDELIRYAIRFDPPLQPGTRVTVRVTRPDGEVAGYPVAIETEAPTDCWFGDVPIADFQPGRYHWWFEWEGEREIPRNTAFVVLK
jgi:hypothetical protein